MKFLGKKITLNSLRLRLALGLATCSTLGFGGLAIAMGIKMQNILVSTNKENIKYIANRFPEDVKIYSDMVTLEEGTQKAIDRLSENNNKILFWVKNNGGIVTAKSSTLDIKNTGDILLSLNNVPAVPQVRDLQGNYWLLCASPLRVKGVDLGEFYIAQDITSEQKMFFSLIRSLTIASLMAIFLMTLIYAFYINHSLKPLKKISQITANISADRLKEKNIQLHNPPSEVKELAETFDLMLVRLANSWEHQRDLLSNVSHELRTPLTIISGYIQSTLRRGDNLTEIQREALSVAGTEADRTVQLLRELMDLARADTDSLHFSLTKVVLNDLLREIINIFAEYGSGKGESIVKVKGQLTQDIIRVDIDTNRFKQIMFNLIDNAIKYSEPDREVVVKLDREKNWAKISVCDRGIGISLKQQARIFERFYRVDEARNRAGGTGLGLAIVKTLVEGMGGNIIVRSKLGEGSTFIISFPLV